MSDQLYAALAFLIAADYIAIKCAANRAGYGYMASSIQGIIQVEMEEGCFSAQTHRVALQYYTSPQRKHLLELSVLEELKEAVKDYAEIR
jgi:hypothetical protein